MAVGFSGSNGGIGLPIRVVSPNELTCNFFKKFPLEVSYFVNNVCNLHCKHCYVNYERHTGNLGLDEWRSIFETLIECGGRTFGNVGMEPLLSRRNTFDLLEFFAEKRQEYEDLRFGMVTNGIHLTSATAEELVEIGIDYLDVSVDGQKSHDFIRGPGQYELVLKNLAALPDPLKEKVFISFNLNRITKDGLMPMVNELRDIGIRNFLISPYITVVQPELDKLWLAPKVIGEVVEQTLEEFVEEKDMRLYFKSEFQSSSEVMEEYLRRGFIDLGNISVDRYGTIFSNQGNAWFNYLPMDTTYIKDIRISHDGYVSGCLDMFFKDYPWRTRGNIREVPIASLLSY